MTETPLCEDAPALYEDAPVGVRLNKLFSLCLGPNGKPWTNVDVAASIKETNPKMRISASYLSKLRTGDRTQPSYRLLCALAEFFGVQPTYFWDTDSYTRTVQQLDALGALRFRGILRIANRTEGLNQDSIEMIIDLLDQAREQQGLPPVSAEDY